MPSLILFTLTDDLQFYGLEVSLSNILMIGLFCSNNRIVIFSKTEKEIILQQTRKGPYIYEVNMEVRWGVLIFVTCLQVFLFLNKRSNVHFYRWRGWRGSQNWASPKKCMTPKWFKITTNSIIKGISFFFNIKQARYIFTA